MTHGENPMVEVREGRLGRCVVVSRSADRGDMLVRGWGTPSTERTMHSIQVDHEAHVEVGSPIRYFNHSCEPNCGLLIRSGREELEVHALRHLAAGDELTLDYSTFEFEIQFMPHPCLCGAATCRGQITGFKDLPLDLVEYYGDYIAEYLQQMALVERSA